MKKPLRKTKREAVTEVVVKSVTVLDGQTATLTGKVQFLGAVPLQVTIPDKDGKLVSKKAFEVIFLATVNLKKEKASG